MPRPVFVLFSDAGAVDGLTNRVSFFNVIETIQVPREVIEASAASVAATSAVAATAAQKKYVAQSAQSMAPKAGMGQRISAAWMREEGDTPEVEYETQVACLSPGGVLLFSSPAVPFTFTQWFQRFDVVGVQIPAFPAIGIYEIESRVRRAGAEEWQWRQSFPFIVEEHLPASPNSGDIPIEDVSK